MCIRGPSLWAVPPYFLRIAETLLISVHGLVPAGSTFPRVRDFFRQLARPCDGLSCD